MSGDANFLTDGMQQQIESEAAIEQRSHHYDLAVRYNRYSLRIFSCHMRVAGCRLSAKAAVLSYVIYLSRSFISIFPSVLRSP
jgi:hypothetical protein